MRFFLSLGKTIFSLHFQRKEKEKRSQNWIHFPPTPATPCAPVRAVAPIQFHPPFLPPLGRSMPSRGIPDRIRESGVPAVQYMYNPFFPLLSSSAMGASGQTTNYTANRPFLWVPPFFPLQPCEGRQLKKIKAAAFMELPPFSKQSFLALPSPPPCHDELWGQIYSPLPPSLPFSRFLFQFFFPCASGLRKDEKRGERGQ